jgi:LPXTG-motif cell wall-anchored protein
VACINDSDDTINDSDDTINDSDDTINDSEVSPTSLTKTGGEGSTAIVGAGLALLTLGAAAGLVGRRRKIEG